MSVESFVFPFVLLDLSLFLDEILMPGFSTNYARCKLRRVWTLHSKSSFLFTPIYVKFFGLNCAWILVFQVMHCAMFGEHCEMVRKFFVRVLRSSRGNLIMSIIQMCSVVSESKVLLFSLLLQFSVLCYKSNIGYKVQFLVVLLVVIRIVVV